MPKFSVNKLRWAHDAQLIRYFQLYAKSLLSPRSSPRSSIMMIPGVELIQNSPRSKTK